ncbi:MAG: hypothetical protein HWE22_15460 [Flavobacteriales bacterium]|nr:hypothetical protein [Flavobacteriales bacterium]
MKSKSLPERIALIELDSSHDECLLTQVHALKRRNCFILLVTNDLVRKRNHHLESLVDEWIHVDDRPENARIGLTGAAIGDALIIRRLMRKLKRKHIDKVIFNTAQGGHVRNACLFSLFRKIEFIGVIHTTRKFQGSFTQRVINLKIKKYCLLADFLKEQVISTSPDSSQVRQAHKFQITSFYPLDFPKSETTVPENDVETHIALMGSVETRRKDLDGFISLVEQCDSNVHFHFLGKADPQHVDVIHLNEKLTEMGRLNQVTFYDSFVDFDTVDLILRKSSAVLPLIHPDTPSAEEYFRHQIPGSMNIALGYRLPLLIHEAYRKIDELNAASIYYGLSTFSNALEELKSTGIEIRNAIKSNKRFASEYQYETYLRLVFE